MSSFRIKQINQGKPDIWIFRKNDGVTAGDDIVADDPNDLARAMYDTQYELTKGTISSGSIFDPVKGAMQRIIELEGQVAAGALAVSLQRAYETGPNITLSSIIGNFKINNVFTVTTANEIILSPTTFRIINSTDNTNYIDISSTRIMNMGSTFEVGNSTNNSKTTLSSAGEVYLKDVRGPSIGIPLSHGSYGSLPAAGGDPAYGSIVGSINALYSLTASNVNLQKSYQASVSPQIETSVLAGPLTIQPASPQASTTVALEIKNGVLKAHSVSVGGNITLGNNGNIITPQEVKAGIVSGGRYHSEATINFTDINIGISPFPLSDPSNKKPTSGNSIFAAINKNSSDIAISSSNINSLGYSHYLSGTHSGKHHPIDIIRNETDPSANAINLTQGSLVNTFFRVTGAGNLSAVGLNITNALGTAVIYNVKNKIVEFDAHKADHSGLDHIDLFNHLGRIDNPHHSVGIITVGSTDYRDNINLSGGTGISITGTPGTPGSPGTPNSIVISNDLYTFQSIYDVAPNASLTLSDGKDIYFSDSTANEIARINKDSFSIDRPIKIGFATGSVAKDIMAKTDLSITAAKSLILESSSVGGKVEVRSQGSIHLVPGKASPVDTVVIEGIKFQPQFPVRLPSFMPQTLMETINKLSNNIVFTKVTTVASSLSIGTPVAIGTASSLLYPANNYDGRKNSLSGFLGFIAQTAAPLSQAIIQTKGTIAANIGSMGTYDFIAGDDLYLARKGSAYIQFSGANKGTVASGQTITIDSTGLMHTFTASNAADPNLGQFQIPATTDTNLFIRDIANNIVLIMNNTVYKPQRNFYAFVDGTGAKGSMKINGAVSVGDTITITHLVNGPTILTAVNEGSISANSDFEVSTSLEITANNLAKAIKDTSYMPSGHNVNPTLLGTTILLETEEASSYANSLVTITTISPNIIVTPSLTGGKSEIRLFMAQKEGGSTKNATTNAPFFLVNDFDGDEFSNTPLIAKRMMNSLYRKTISHRERDIKVGTILEITHNPNPGDGAIILISG